MAYERLIQHLQDQQREIWVKEELIRTELQNWAVKQVTYRVGDVIDLPEGRGTKRGKVTAITGAWESEHYADDKLNPVVRVHYKPIKRNGELGSHRHKIFYFKPEVK